MKSSSMRARSLAMCAVSVAGLASLTGIGLVTVGGTPARAESTASGQQLYAMHCGRCHTERYATERTDAQWKTVMLHMQVRASLNGADAKKIVEYLQASNK